ncbi:MAG: hypothetical protein E7409_00970, partial [Ruminococcaceae bacterium]|nr:hypothetical protein [Oscillospiraceae bacterium]
MRRVLSILMAVVMVLGTMGFTAFAEDETQIWADAADISWYNDVDTSFTLTTAAQLAGLSKLVNEGNNFSGKAITLGGDIDLENKEWTPIGSEAAQFKGAFDGDGNTISNLYINLPETKGTGLFGFINGQGISASTAVGNFIIDNAKIICKSYTGVAIGQSWCNDDIEDITVTGKVEIDGTMSDLAGIVGYCGYNNIKNCHVLADEGSYIKKDSETSWFMGGIVGYMCEGNYIIQNCSVENLMVEGGAYAGGIAGCLQSGVELDGTCEVENVVVKANGAGLLAGAAYYTTDETMETKLATAEVSATGSKLYDGGVEVLYPSLAGSEPIVAVIGDDTYTALEDAIADADADDVVILVKDVTMESDLVLDLDGSSLVINLNNKTLSLTGNTTLFDGSYTIKNGTVDLEGVACTNGEGLIRIAPHSSDATSLALESVTVEADGYSAPCGLFFFEDGELSLDNTVINSKDVTDGGSVFYSMPTDPQALTISNSSEIHVNGAAKLFYGCNVEVNDSEIDATVKKDIFSGASAKFVNSNLVFSADRAIFNDAGYLTSVSTVNSEVDITVGEEGEVSKNINESSVILSHNSDISGADDVVDTPLVVVGTSVYTSFGAALDEMGTGETIMLNAGLVLTKDNMDSIDEKEGKVELGENVLTVEFAEDEDVVDYSELIEVPSKYTLKVNEETGEDGKTIVTYQLKKKKSNTSLGVSGGIGGSGGSGVVMVSNYTVTFEANGGSAVAGQLVQAGGKATEPVAPEKEGYVFDGWYADAALTEAYDFDATVGKNITIYAKWTEKAASNQIILT